MESLSSVRTIMGIVQDILSAVETASQNKSRCKKVAKRVRCIKDILEAAAQDGTTSTAATDDATRTLMGRLEEALSSALQVVRQCQRSSFLGSVVGVVVAGGRMAESLDGVEREIDRCILDLTLANSLRIARFETLLVRRQHAMAAAAASSTEDSIVSDEKDDDENKGRSAESVVVPENTTTATAAIGVPVCTAAVHEHRHEMVVPSYGYYGYCWSCRSYHSHCYYWRRNHGCRDDDGDAGGPSNAALYRIQYSSYPSMFSDDDPNSCSIM